MSMFRNRGFYLEKADRAIQLRYLEEAGWTVRDGYAFRKAGPEVTQGVLTPEDKRCEAAGGEFVGVYWRLNPQRVVELQLADDAAALAAEHGWRVLDPRPERLELDHSQLASESGERRKLREVAEELLRGLEPDPRFVAECEAERKRWELRSLENTRPLTEFHLDQARQAVPSLEARLAAARVALAEREAAWKQREAKREELEAEIAALERQARGEAPAPSRKRSAA